MNRISLVFVILCFLVSSNSMNLKKKAANEPGNNSQNVDIISQATLAGSELGFRDGYEYGFLNGFNNNSDDEEEHKAPEVPKFPEGKNPPTKKELEDFAQGYLDGYAEGKKVGSKDGIQVDPHPDAPQARQRALFALGRCRRVR